MFSQLRLYDGAKSVPGRGDIADDHDLIGRKRRGDHANAAAELECHFLERADGLFISTLRQLEEEIEAVRGSGRGKVVVVTEGRAVGGQHLPAAMVAAGAEGAVGVDLDVAELSRHAVIAA